MTVNETLSVQTPHAGVVVLQLNRPERLNAINHVMVGELKETLAAPDHGLGLETHGAGLDAVQLRHRPCGVPKALSHNGLRATVSSIE